MSARRLAVVLADARACRLCESQLPHGPRPVLRVDARARILIIGQAPGSKVHASGVDWDDASGQRLRDWMGTSREVFYGPRIAVLPMGLCYPGRGASGDLPPRPECAPAWHPRIRPLLPEVRLTLLVGAYAQRRELGASSQANLTATVRAFEQYLPRFFVLPHPSPRNAIWQRKNPWFLERCVPALASAVASALA